MSAFRLIMSASRPTADVNGCPSLSLLLTQVVWKLFFGDRDEILIRVTAVVSNNDLRVRHCRVYCCAEALPTRVFTQPGPTAEVDGAVH